MLKRLKSFFSSGDQNPKVVDIVSIHIPKTAGLSFREILFKVYGKDGVYAKNRGELQKEGITIEGSIPKSIRVFHGHLHYAELKGIIGPESRIITWFREPVKRVISNYYYNITHEFPKRKLENPDLKKFSLEEFIEKPNRQNVMSQFLEGISLEKIFFLGFQEDFNSDLGILARKLSWEDENWKKNERLNDNSKVRDSAPETSQEIIDRIKEVNQKDIELYHRALALKSKGHWK